MSERTETQERIRGVVEDAIRFGSAVGSWHTSRIRWHQRAGRECINAVRDAAVSEIEMIRSEKDNGYCHYCHGKPKKVVLAESIKENEQ